MIFEEVVKDGVSLGLGVNELGEVINLHTMEDKEPVVEVNTGKYIVRYQYQGNTAYFSVADEVLFNFKPLPDNAALQDLTAHHIDGDFSNCNLSNLLWKTRSRVSKKTKHPADTIFE